MIDAQDSNKMGHPVDLAVVGGGIAGWSAALTAATAGASVVLLEAHEHGGRARTIERDGYAHNIGPHGLYLHGHLQGLLDRHGIHVAGTLLDVGSTRVAVRGELHDVTFGPVGLLRTTALRPVARARVLRLFARLPRLRPADFVGRTVADWLGDEPDDVQAFIGTFVRIPTYTDAPGEFDAGAAIAQVQLSMRGVRYVDGGWAKLVSGLSRAAVAAGVRATTATEVHAVESDGRDAIVHTATGEVRARSVVIATGGPEVAERLTGSTVAGRGALTAPVAATTLDLALVRPHLGTAFGVDEPLYLSPHAPTARLAPEGRGLVCVMRYLAPGEAPAAPTDERERLRAFAALAGIPADDVVHEWALHRSIVTHGAPTARGGGLPGRPAIDALGMPGVLVAGDWVGPDGLIADASAASGEAAARAVLRACASIGA